MKQGGRTLAALREALGRLEGRGYKAYKEVEGSYEAGRFELVLDHAQGDPFADASRVRALVAPGDAGLPAWALESRERRLATADFLNRSLDGCLSARSRPRGSGNSGRLAVLRPGQEVLARASLVVDEAGAVEARFRVGLPARGRRILGSAAAELVTVAVPEAIHAALFFAALDVVSLRRHVEAVEDAEHLRSQLAGAGLVALIADGALLPRRSGVDDRPLEAGAVPFRAPAERRETLRAPNAGAVRGLGIPRGVTLVTGGGYHGKSTLLRAIERGVYDHVPGDGRERVVTVPGAVKVRAEDGRRVSGTDISNFIGALPDGTDTRRFVTDNASGSTSQAAAIIEALEVGATALLLDEDTSATNFMIRDARMQRLVAPGSEPITPFIDRARQLYEELGVSSVIVVGGSGDYFDIADTVIAMDRYRAVDLTSAAGAVAEALPSPRRPEGGAWASIAARSPAPGSIDPRRGARAASIRVVSRDRVQFGSGIVDLGGVEQVVEEAQARAIAHAAAWARERIIDGERTMAEVVDAVAAIEQGDPSVFHPHRVGELASFRRFELAAFLNRLRTLETRTAQAR